MVAPINRLCCRPTGSCHASRRSTERGLTRPRRSETASVLPRAAKRSPVMTIQDEQIDGSTTLVSFDVDGTLIESIGEEANYLHKAAFAHGFKSVFGIDTTIEVIKHHGGTDPLILLKVLQHHGVPLEQGMARLKECEAAMCDYFDAHSDKAQMGLRLLPGVKELLAELQARAPSVHTCLVTGNLQPIGWTKMRALGVEELFTCPRFGGFGSDFCSGNVEEMWRDRAEFVRIAAERCRAQASASATFQHFHVGDTPMDIQAAEAAGAVAVAVATGVFTKEALQACSPNAIVLDSLASLPQALAALGLPTEPLLASPSGAAAEAGAQ